MTQDSDRAPVMARPATQAVAPLPASDAPTLEYGHADTQFGLIFDHHPDGGVTVTVPGTKLRYLRKRLSGVHNGPEGLFVILIFAAQKLMRRPTPPRAVIHLSASGLKITEPGRGLDSADAIREWPLDRVGEIRPNRYSKGVYVRLPGQDNFDALTDLPRAMADRVGRTLEEALARLKPKNAP